MLGQFQRDPSLATTSFHQPQSTPSASFLAHPLRFLQIKYNPNYCGEPGTWTEEMTKAWFDISENDEYNSIKFDYKGMGPDNKKSEATRDKFIEWMVRYDTESGQASSRSRDFNQPKYL